MAKGVQSFLGERLIQAREIRGLTGVNLASIAGISSSSVSQYEHGTASPTQDVIERLAAALNVKPAFFLLRHNQSDGARFYWRSLSSATKQARRRAQRKYEWLCECAEYFEGVFDFPVLNMPVFNVNQSAEAITGDDIESYAKECRTFWNLGDSPIQNVIHVIEKNGVLIGRFPLEAETLDGLSEWTASTRPAIIIASDKSSCARSRFDASHELAHYLLHRNVSSRTSEIHALMESQAHRFAGAFLLPRESYLKELRSPTLESFLALKERWRVSIAMQIHRCFNLGVIDEDSKKRLFISLSKRGWRRKEPGDDKMPAEYPRLFRQCVDAMLEAGFKTRQQIADDLERPAEDIEEICGLPDGYLRDDFGEMVKLPSFKTPTMRVEGDTGEIIPFRS
ncbi:MAG: XRE family transcriptional regulator [Planctomycetales bacterium]